jgi:hypothetical protein
MPEEIEAPTEHLQEQLHEAAEKPEAKWIPYVALTAALLAVAAAIAALLAGHHANEAMLEQMRATDQWAFFQAKGIKSAVLESKLDLLKALGKETSDEERGHLATYEAERKKIEDTGNELERSSEKHMGHHNKLARAVTVFQIAIALAAIAVLLRRRSVWGLSCLLGAVGAVFLVLGIV